MRTLSLSFRWVSHGAARKQRRSGTAEESWRSVRDGRKERGRNKKKPREQPRLASQSVREAAAAQRADRKRYLGRWSWLANRKHLVAYNTTYRRRITRGYRWRWRTRQPKKKNLWTTTDRDFFPRTHQLRSCSKGGAQWTPGCLAGWRRDAARRRRFAVDRCDAPGGFPPVFTRRTVAVGGANQKMVLLRATRVAPRGPWDATSNDATSTTPRRRDDVGTSSWEGHRFLRPSWLPTAECTLFRGAQRNMYI